MSLFRDRRKGNSGPDGLVNLNPWKGYDRAVAPGLFSKSDKKQEKGARAYTEGQARRGLVGTGLNLDKSSNVNPISTAPKGSGLTMPGTFEHLDSMAASKERSKNINVYGPNPGK